MVRVVDKRIPLDRWIEANIHLPQGLTAEPGPIRLAPYMREIARTIGDPAIERVSIQKSARIGYTTVMTGALAYHIVVDPAPVLVLVPTESDARDYAITDFENTLLDSPNVAPHLPMPSPGRSTRVTILHRPFKGGSITSPRCSAWSRMRGSRATLSSPASASANAPRSRAPFAMSRAAS